MNGSRTWVAIVLVGLMASLLGFSVGRAASPRRSEGAAFKDKRPRPRVALKVDSTADPAEGAPPSTVDRTVPESPRPDPAWTAQEAILDFTFGIISDDDDRLRQAFWSVLYRDRMAQDQFLDLFLGLEDPEMLECSGEFLIWARAPDQLKRIAESFESDAHPGRRAGLAMALGYSALDPIARPLVESILMGGDASLQAAALQRMTVESLSRDAELASRLAPRIRDFLRTGESVSLRVAAAGALRGDKSEEAKRLLMDRMLNDPAPEVQERCAWSLPIDGETLDLSWGAVQDAGKNHGVRRAAARLILNAADRRIVSLTDEQRKSLQELTQKR